MSIFNKLLIIITFLLLSITAQAQVSLSFTSGVKYAEQTRKYQFTSIGLVGPIIQGATEQTQNVQNFANNSIRKANDLPFVSIDTINIAGVNDFFLKQREINITRYLMTGTGRLAVDGVELLGTLELGISSAVGLTAGANASIFINPGLMNWFGFDIEPLDLGTFTQLHWIEMLSVGYTYSITSESMFFNNRADRSIDVKFQLPITNDADRKMKRFNLYVIKTFYLSDVKGWQGGITYKF